MTRITQVPDHRDDQPRYESNSSESSQAAGKLQVAWTSAVVTVILIVAKLSVGLATGSLVILSQAADSAFDLISVLVTLFAMRMSSVPPDEDHPFGHGKFESLSALVESLFLLGLTIWIATEAIGHLFGGHTSDVHVTIWSYLVLAGSIALDYWRAHKLKKAAQQHNSHALEASSLHFFADIWSAVVALAGITMVGVFGIRNADDWAALVLAVFVAGLSVRLGKRAVDALTDRFTSSEDYARLRTLVEETPGIESVNRLRIRPVGPSLFVEASVAINRILPFAAIERILYDVEASILSAYPNADVTVHWRPIRVEAEAPFETLKIIVAEFGVLPHNVELAELKSGAIALDYHLEFRPGTGLEEAEKLCQQIEQKVRKELPQVSTIFAHLEEERSDRSLPVLADVSERRSEVVREVIEYGKQADRGVQNVGSVHLLQDERFGSLKLMLSVDVAASLSLAEAHTIVTNVEDTLRKRFPEFDRIVIHANPVAI